MQKQIILFDGVCNLCNAAVQWVIRRDKHRKFLFASLQSELAQQLLAQRGFISPQLTSLVLIVDHDLFLKSDAVLRIARQLSGAWKLAYWLKVVPRFMRDGAYDFVAGHRYKWFGKKAECMVPTPNLRSRFLD
jgi:predicted DCC family thiol-disulfide oxidoreductase YuxK